MARHDLVKMSKRPDNCVLLGDLPALDQIKAVESVFLKEGLNGYALWIRTKEQKRMFYLGSWENPEVVRVFKGVNFAVDVIRRCLPSIKEIKIKFASTRTLRKRAETQTPKAVPKKP